MLLTKEAIALFARSTSGKRPEDYIFLRSDGQPWQPSQQTRRMKEVCKTAGINPPVSFHGLRHAFGGFLVDKGVSSQFIARALGHKDSRMSERVYAQVKDKELARKLEETLPRIRG